MTQRTPLYSMDSSEYSGKRFLVTGGTKGAGEAIVRRLAAGGAVIATTARSGLPEGLTPDVFVQADLSTPEGVSKVAETVLRELRGVPGPQCRRFQHAWRRLCRRDGRALAGGTESQSSFCCPA